MTKTKQPQSKVPESFQGKDGFLTPRYAVELLIPYIPKHVKSVWECAAGDRRISRVLDTSGYKAVSTDIRIISDGVTLSNFLTDKRTCDEDAIITNPPFSLKEEFYLQCLKYGKPFALLIPFDMSYWLVEAFRNGAQGIVPDRRIDYLTPNILRNVSRKLLWKNRKDLFSSFSSYKDVSENEWDFLIDMFGKEYVYEKIDDVPEEILRKSSSSDFHSFWLVGGFNLPEKMVFPELHLNLKKRIL